MPLKRKPLSEQLRQAILKADKTRYRIAQESGVGEGQLSRFVRGRTKLTLDSIDKIGTCLGLQLVRAGKRKGR